MNFAHWLNTAWMLRQSCELAAFHRATRSVAETQEAVLREIIARNRRSEFGAAHNFADIHSPAEFARFVPLSTYDDYHEAIRQIAAGRQRILTEEPVRLLEPTSGSTGGEKLIPYTRTLRAQFQRAIGAWIADLLCARPAVRRGTAYWSISPALTPKRFTEAGIPIGFDDDTAYLGTIERFALRKLLAVPAAASGFSDVENFRYYTLLHLLAADDLGLISIWSPTFLITILEHLEGWGERICRDLRDGRMRLPTGGSDLSPKFQANLSRATEGERILDSSLSLAEKLERIWPRLALISCWTDGASSRYLPQLRALFPRVEIQPKGLLATEAFVSFPLINRPGAALAIRSHYFEFLKMDGDPWPYAADQLELGAQYHVVVTTGGGLYRYQLGDVVEVVGFENQCPRVRFIGRVDRVSDLVGEKLSEADVQQALDQAYAAHGIEAEFSLMVAVAERRCYRLYLQCAGKRLTAASIGSLAELIERELSKNPYYRHAVEMGQLTKLEIAPLSCSTERAWAAYERACLAHGQKVGGIKPAILNSWAGWPEHLDGLVDERFIEKFPQSRRVGTTEEILAT